MLQIFTFCPIIWTAVFSTLVFVHGAPTSINDNDGESVNIIGGEPANPGEFPFIVSLQLKSKADDQPNVHTCGATLYNMSRVITAAACVRSRVTSNFVIVAGAHTMNEAILGHQQTRNIRQITLHPNFDPVGDFLRDDIAVVDLVEPFDDTATVTSIPLARRNQQYSGTCVIAGWGTNDFNDSNYSEKLMKGRVTIRERSVCAVYNEYDENFQICANGKNDNGDFIDACSGDLGGPLICSNEDGSPYLAGISSYGHMCGSEEQPGVYMEIAKYRSWLDTLMFEGGNGGTTSTTTIPSTPSTTPELSNDPIEDSNGDDADNAASQEDQVANKPVQDLCRGINRK